MLRVARAGVATGPVCLAFCQRLPLHLPLIAVPVPFLRGARGAAPLNLVPRAPRADRCLHVHQNTAPVCNNLKKVPVPNLRDRIGEEKVLRCV